MSKKLNVKFWEVSGLSEFQYPEVTDPDLKYQPVIDRLKNHNCGIAFSGGGTVSAALAPGFIKALEDIGVMKNVAYISGVSGGTWGTAAYCYALDAYHRWQYYNGVIENAKGLTLEGANANPPAGSMVEATTKAKITYLGLKDIFDGKYDYTETVGKIFLEPFGLDNLKKKYFTTDKKALADILSRNSDLTKDDFYLLYQNEGNSEGGATSPYYIMNGSMFTPPPDKEVTKYETYPFEFTPLYSGMKGPQPESANEAIGGAYVESFGFNSKHPKSKEVYESGGEVEVDKPEKVFDLSSPVGTSGSAIEKIVASLFPDLKNPLLWLLPKFEYWNPNSKKFDDTNQFLYGDGGITENTGISPLLRRHVQNIVLFITEPLDVKPLSDRPCERSQRQFGHNQFAGLFGAPKKKYNKTTGKYDLIPNTDSPYKFFEEAEFAPIAAELDTLKAKGGPIVVTKRLAVQKNLHFGIEGGWFTNVTFVVIDTCTQYNEQLDKSLYSDGKFVPKELNNFPAICTFLQNAKEEDLWNAHLIQLTNAQANLLASQAYWMVKNSPQIKNALTAPNDINGE